MPAHRKASVTSMTIRERRDARSPTPRAPVATPAGTPPTAARSKTHAGDGREGLPTNPESRTNATHNKGNHMKGMSAVRRQERTLDRLVRDEDVAGIRGRQDPRKNGFTLMELLIVMVLLGILVAMGLSSFRGSQTKSRDSRRKAELRQISLALEAYFNDKGRYPNDDGS